ncbi:MAG: hypothetical protein HWN66_10725 [Candidatus Helarchaeota archaeon]|nr:hypothetical protein [Candidatus Helarchaeota archaeon]
MGGLLVIIVGIFNIIQLFLVDKSDPKAVLLFAVYGIIFLVGGLIFFAVAIRGILNFKKLIINASSILLLMCAISNAIYLLTGNGGVDIIPLSLSVVNIILCLSTLPMTFTRYANLEDMDAREKVSYVSLILLRGSGLFHILQPLIYEFRLETIGMLVFGVLYILIALMLSSRKDANLIQLIGFILPIIGAILGTVLLFIYLTPYVIVFIIFDGIISPIRFYYIKTQ